MTTTHIPSIPAGITAAGLARIEPDHGQERLYTVLLQAASFPALAPYPKRYRSHTVRATNCAEAKAKAQVMADTAYIFDGLDRAEAVLLASAHRADG